MNKLYYCIFFIGCIAVSAHAMDNNADATSMTEAQRLNKFWDNLTTIQKRRIIIGGLAILGAGVVAGGTAYVKYYPKKTDFPAEIEQLDEGTKNQDYPVTTNMAVETQQGPYTHRVIPYYWPSN